MSKKKNSNVLKGLIRIGIFSALWVVVAFLIACTIGFFPPRSYRDAVYIGYCWRNDLYGDVLET